MHIIYVITPHSSLLTPNEKELFMNKQTILLALLAVSLIATGVVIRTFSFAEISLGHLALLTALSALDCLLWFFWKRSGGN